MKTVTDKALERLDAWWEGLPRYRRNGGRPAWGTTTAGLVVLDRLRADFSLQIEDHLAAHSSQIAGLNRSRVQRILARFDAERPVPVEAGRTNLGYLPHIARLLKMMASLDLRGLPQDERELVLDAMQGWLIRTKLNDYPHPGGLRFRFVEQATASTNVHGLLATAERARKAGPVAYHLVGAKLALRFPNVQVRNDSYSTADAPSGQPGDFVVGDTVFHVTVAPMLAHYDKCKANVAAGYEVMLLAPQDMVAAIVPYMQKILPGRATVDAIEAFVGRNLDDLGQFRRVERIAGLRKLLEVYNARVDQVETDKSLLIEMPRNLQG